MSKRPPLECAYCGSTQELTTDHVVPKLLFTQPYPPDLITVKACRTCHDIKNSDENEEYLRDLLTSDIYGSQSSTAKQIFQEGVLGSVRRNSSPFVRIAMKNMQYLPFHSRQGVYLRHAFSAPIDEERNKTIFSTIARGLYYNSRGQILPATYNFDLLRYHPWDFKQVFEKFMEMNPNGVRGLGDVFGSVFLSAEEDPCSTLWLMWFYERVFILVSAMNPKLQGG